jgi:hypothetical protein
MDLKVAKRHYWSHRGNAKKRNIPFLFTFEEWCYVWEQSGKWDQRGSGRGKYNMSRYGDKGPYTVDNVYINLHENNAREGHLGSTLKKETKDKIGASQLGKLRQKIKVTCPHCNLTGGHNIMPRYHFDNCKKKNPSKGASLFV